MRPSGFPVPSPRPVAPSDSGSPPVCAPPPAPCGVPAFPPLRVRGGSGHRLRRAVWRQRRAMAAGLALTAAALAASGLGGSGGGGGEAAHGASGASAGSAGTAPEQASPPARLVSAPVRIADAATVRLLRPGDHVDVIASEGPDTEARVLAKNARVTQVPQASAEGSLERGALIVLSVPRTTAATLAGAGVSAGLAVILC
ncbi:RcpC/CpaB family pilus assembly protein [Streptomyces sp. RKAG290]|uniref:RcpC/CpaB family pilus assembly protein n=1 Tax=Streptomyces sp. RKAG290 TaxID=2888348 RepID=UPI0035A97391